MTPEDARLRTEQERVIADHAHTLYRNALVDPALDVGDVLWLQDVALTCFRDYLTAIEREQMIALDPRWLRALLVLIGVHRISAGVAHVERIRRRVRRG